MFVGRLRFGELASGKVDVEVPLARPVDAVSPIEPSIEPLRRVRRCHLLREHVDKLVEEGVRVRLRIEIAALPTPVGPGAGEPLEDLFRGMFADAALLFRKLRQSRFVGSRAPQPRGNGLLLDLLQPRGDPCLAEVFLGQHVGGDLRPEAWHFDVVGVEHHRAVRIANLAFRQPERDVRVRGLSFLRVSPLNPHRSPLIVGAAARCGPPTHNPWRDLGLPAVPTTGSYSPFSASPHSPTGLLRHSRARPFQATKSRSPAPLRQAERLRRPLQESARRDFEPLAPNFLKVKTAPALRQGLV